VTSGMRRVYLITDLFNKPIYETENVKSYTCFIYVKLLAVSHCTDEDPTIIQK
jgi:hypothetical protein